MTKLSRFFRHLLATKASGKRAFPATSLQSIQTAIAEGEALHRAEVRLIIEPSLSIGDVLAGQHARQRARELFSLYRIWDTEENCGVLVYINLADHKVEIISDRAVGRALHASQWQAVCKTMTQGFAQGLYEESVLAAIRQLNDLLHAHFPASGDTVNELSNRPLIV